MKSFKELMEIVAPDVKTDLKGLDATSFAKKHGKSKTEIKNTFESAEEKVPEPGREAVGGRFTSRPPKSVIRPAPQVASEEVEQIEEGRPSQRHPLEGHEYHKKTDAELVYIAKDAHKAAEAMKSHNTTAENKYRDQANDSATVRYFRQKNGMPDWYKKKYGHMKEDIERVEEMDKSQTPPGRDGGYQFAPGPKVSKKDIEAVKKNPAKHLSDLFAKEYAKKKMKEEVVDEAKDPKEYGYEGDMAMNQLQTIMRHAEYLMDMMKPDTDLPEWVQSKITLATDYLQTSCDYMTSEMKEEVEQIDEDMTKDVQKTKDGGYWSKGTKTATHYSGKKTYEYKKFDKEGKETGERHYRDAQGNYMGEAVEPPFTPNKPKTSSVAGKFGKGYSTARHLARMAMQKQVDKLKKPVKESLEESRKAEIVKDIVKKKKAATEDTFQKDPELSSSLTKTQ